MTQEIPKINSLAVTLAREYILKNNLPEAVDKFQASLDQAEKELFFDIKTGIFNFIDEKMFFDILSRYDSFRRARNLSAVLDIARYTGKNAMPKIWSGFLKNGDFAVIVRSSKFAWRTMHSQGGVEIVVPSDTKGFVTTVGGYKHPAHCEYIRGFILGMSDMFENIKSIAVTETACVFRGAPQCQYTLSWIKK